MMVFVDTSALYAMLVQVDGNHKSAASAMHDLRESRAHLVTSNYVVVETCALLLNRQGMAAVKALRDVILQLVTVHWIDEHLHDRGMDYHLASGRNGPSLVDCTSFALMRKTGIRTALAFDKHFAQEGFKSLA
jgi:predicted nucleic acid-binding protein